MSENIVPTIEPTIKQHYAYQKLWDRITRFILFGGGAEGGKSWLGNEWLITNCYRYPGSKWFIGRKELKDIMATTYITFQKVCAFHHIPQSDWHLNGEYNYIQFRNSSRIDLLDLKPKPTDPEFQSLGSLEFTGGWVEEAGEVEFKAFDVLKARVGRWKNDDFGLTPPKILLTCNPFQNWLYRLFYKPFKKGELADGYAFIQSLYNDNPYTAKGAEERLNQITDPVTRARLKEGLWEYDSSEGALMNYDAIVDLFTNTVELSPEKYLTEDVARFGRDRIVTGLWQGLNLTEIVEKGKQGLDITTQETRDLLIQRAIPYSHAIIDDDGVGGGVTDNIKGIKGFIGNASPIKRKEQVRTKDGLEEVEIKENYLNLRSQCYFMLAEKVNTHQVAISAKISEEQKELIIQDLQQVRRKEKTADAPLQIVSKEEMKALLGRSPDFGDMIMMRMFAELNSKTFLEGAPAYYKPPPEVMANQGVQPLFGKNRGFG